MCLNVFLCNFISVYVSLYTSVPPSLAHLFSFSMPLSLPYPNLISYNYQVFIIVLSGSLCYTAHKLIVLYTRGYDNEDNQLHTFIHNDIR